MPTPLPTLVLAPEQKPRWYAALGTRLVRRSDDGAVTAEYAVTTIAACGFAGILYEILKSDTVINLVVKVISKALGWLL
jgi:Protein of unknown function (DUF4244)